MSLPIQPQPRVGDIDSTFRVLVRERGVALDISSASVMNLKLKKPSGTVVTKAMAFTSGGTDGRVQYVTIDGDLDEPGAWMGQVYIEMGLKKFHTTQFSFQVGENL